MKKIVLLALGMAPILSGCSSDEIEKVRGDIITIPVTDNIELTTVENTVNAKMNDAAFELLNTMAQNFDEINKADDNDNLTVSPISVSMAMAMVANSIDGPDAAICDLYGAADVEELNALSNKLIRYLSSTKDGTTTKLANSVWYQESYNPVSAYRKLMNEMLYAEIYGVNMHTIETMDMVNSWVRAKTDNMIDHLWDEPYKGELLLLNAMYFNGIWQKAFDPKETRKHVFHGLDGDREVDMMYNFVRADYAYDDDDFDLVSIDFKGDTKFTVIIPKKTTAMEAAKTISASIFDNIERHKVGVQILLPKFSVTNEWDLTNILPLLGLNIGGSLQKMGLPIDNFCANIIHKTALDLNETGARAAAITGVTNFTDFAPTGPQFIVDRPFLFFIHNTVTGSVIMSGCINDL